MKKTSAQESKILGRRITSLALIVLGFMIVAMIGVHEAYAQGYQPVAEGGVNAEVLLGDLSSWFRGLPTLLITIELLVIMVAGLRFMMEPDNQADRQRWNKTLIFGIAALFVTLAVWGLVGFISKSTGIGIGGEVQPPYIQVDNN